jgi:hypothetical protein
MIVITIPSRVCRRRVLNKPTNKDRASSSGTICRIDIGGIGILGDGGIIIPIAEMLTAEFTGVTPSAGVTGLTGVHVTGMVAPVQVIVTAWLKPPSGVMVTLKLPVVFFFTVTVAGAVKVKSQPVPVSGTVCGLPPALSVTVSVPARAPTAVGGEGTISVTGVIHTENTGFTLRGTEGFVDGSAPDEADNRTVFAHSFSPQYAVEVCASGVEALACSRASFSHAAWRARCSAVRRGVGPRRQAQRRAAAGLALQRIHPALPAAPEPLAHRSLADPERHGNVFAPPAGLMQLPGPPAPPGPQLRLCRRCAHASQRSML